MALLQAVKIAEEDEEEKGKAYHPKLLSTEKYPQSCNPSDDPVIEITIDIVHHQYPDDFKEELLPHISVKDRNNLFGTCTDDVFCKLCTLEIGWFYSGYRFKSRDEAVRALYLWKNMVMPAQQKAQSENIGHIVQAFENVRVTTWSKSGTEETTWLRIFEDKKVRMKRFLFLDERQVRPSTLKRRKMMP